MTKEQAIQQLERSIDLWCEFWGESSHYISDEDIDAIQCLIKEAKENGGI